MCLILLSWRQRSDYPLILAANRDEFYDRPTAPAAFWPETPQLLAGRDLAGGGTWLGVTRSGRWAAITNYRDPSDPARGGPSRGWLVRDFLLASDPPRIWLEKLAPTAERWAGFNLLAATTRELFYFSNREGTIRPLTPGLYGLSNGLLDTPWPKTVGGKETLAAAVAAETPDPEALFALLAETSRPSDDQLPETGVGLEWERLLSARFIASSRYGTRSSTLLLLDGEGWATFRERTFSPDGTPPREIRRRFRLP